MENYLEVQWQGRVDQGVWAAAAVMAEVLALEGKYVQAIPGFNGDRCSAFVQAYNRLSDSPLKLHSAVETADFVVIMDTTLILNPNTNVKNNAKENAIYIVNTSAAPGLIKEKLQVPDSRVYTLDADTIVREENGNHGAIPNIPLMTGLIRCMDWIPLEAFKQRLLQSLARLFPAELVLANIKAADKVLREGQELKINQ